MTHEAINRAIASAILKLEILDEGGEVMVKKPDVSLAGQLFESLVPLPKYTKRLDLAMALIPAGVDCFLAKGLNGYWSFGVGMGGRVFTCMTLSEAICSAILHKHGLWVE